MKAQTPAEGILKRGDWGDYKLYQVVCNCGNEYHDHNVEVEAQDTGVNVNIYATVKTNYWSEVVPKSYDIENELAQEAHWFFADLINSTWRKIKLTWQLWTTGAVTTETTIAMTEQQALNYAKTLEQAILDTKAFRQQESKVDK